MTEKEIQLLGFEKEVSLDLINGEPEYYYYVKEITKGLTFITNTDDEAKYDGWYVEFFDTEIPVRYYNYDKVKSLFNLIEEGVITPKQR